MRKLRDPDAGCPWDLAQDFGSVWPYTVEEAYEVADAIERNNMDDLRDELGDLLFQVVFHAQMAEESGFFDLDDVAGSITDKMVRRHPHVFGTEAERADGKTDGSWEQIKEDVHKASLESLDELRFLDPEGLELDRMEIEQLEGMEIAVEVSQGMFVYELRLPFTVESRLPFALTLQTGQDIGIGLEIPKLEREEMQQSMGGGRGGSSRGGGTGSRAGGGRGGGGKRGRPGASSGNFDQDLLKGKKIWATIHLAIDPLS